MNLLSINKFQDKEVVRIASFDPGESTGVAGCILTRQPDGLWLPEIITMTIGWPEGAADLRNIALGADVVVIEEFRVRSKDAKSIVGDRLWSAEVTGWLIGSLETSLPNHTLVKQSPWCKGFCPPKMVHQRLGYWPTLDRAGNPIASHEGDALLHLMYFLSK